MQIFYLQAKQDTSYHLLGLGTSYLVTSTNHWILGSRNLVSHHNMWYFWLAWGYACAKPITKISIHPPPTHPLGTLVHEMAAWKLWHYLSQRRFWYWTECTVQWQSLYSTCVHCCPWDCPQDIYNDQADHFWPISLICTILITCTMFLETLSKFNLLYITW